MKDNMPIRAKYDAIIVGGGHNGLVCGAYLARAGRKVLLLERNGHVGGAAVTREFAPGFRASTFSYLMSLLHPKIIRELELERFGLRILPAADMFTPLPGGDHILFTGDDARNVAEIGRFSEHDARQYPKFKVYLDQIAVAARKLMLQTPIDPQNTSLRGLTELAGFVWENRKSVRQFYGLYDILTMSAYDFLSEWFESDIVKGVYAYYSGIGSFQGPKTPGSAYILLHHLMGEHEGAGGWGFVEGGMGKISETIAQSGAAHGLDILTDAGVDHVETRGGRATGVVCTDGREFEARVVVSNVSAKLLFTKMMNGAQIPEEYRWHLETFRTESAAAKLNIACERLPQFTAFDSAICGFDYPSYAHIAPDVAYLEQAYAQAKEGWYSQRPFVTVTAPTTVDKTLAPPGKHVINLFCGHAPYTLKGGASWEDHRQKFADLVLDVVEEFAPGFRRDIIAMQVLVPPDIERMIGSPNGHIFHGELSVDQLFFKRPAPHFADYRTPIRALYLCGATTHPGGGVSGICGHNAAREIQKDWRRL
jgi:phytoene dehydrogenase-like protein